jgi:RNA-binding protein YhbY
VNALQMSVIDEIKSINTKDMVLVKVKILKAEYHETKTATQQSWWQNAMNTVVTWFGSNQHQYRHDNTYFPAS